MRTFEYKGYNHAGQVARGLIQAIDRKDAREKLAHQGVLAEAIQAAGEGRAWVWRRRDVLFTLDVRAAFYRELASILAAGLPLSNGLALLTEAPEMGRNQTVVAGIGDRVSEGVSFADAVADASARVTAFERAVIETGERAGRIDEVLNRLADYLEEERQLRDRLVSALIYPAIIVGLSLLVGTGLLVFMLPAFQSLLLETGLDLPWITRVVMRGAQVFAWLLPLLVIAGGVASLWIKQRRSRSASFRVAFDRWLHRLPLLSQFYPVLVNLRFTRTLAMLLQSQVHLLEALTQAAAASGSPWVESLIGAEADAVRQGANLSDALARVPPLALTLPGWVRAGEASGDLTGMLEQAAQRSQHVWERRVTRTMTLIESGLVIVVGAFVFVLALSIILPILSINQVLQ